MFSEEEWAALQKVMGHPAWAKKEKFATLADRKANESELNNHIEAWTKQQYASKIMKQLLEHGVKAGIVNDARAAIEDEHLIEREFWAYLDHPVVGLTLYNRAPIMFSKRRLSWKRRPRFLANIQMRC